MMMKLRVSYQLPALAVAFGLLAGAGRAGTADRILFDAPRGAWLAAVRTDAALVVLEEREGWRRVRLEGWIPADAQGAAPAAAGGEATVRGVLAPESAGAPSGAGLIVLLVADLQAVDREKAGAEAACRARLDDATRTLERVKAEKERALNSSDNFREAATRSDRLKTDLESAQKERLARLAECRRSALAIYENHAAARSIADGRGTFVFEHVAPGRYRAVAAEPADGPHVWSLECEVTGPGDVVLDPRRDRTPADPYWGLR
jgi:hypothetical protein